MGIGVQPCCCPKWMAISEGGWLYDLNPESGRLSNPRNTGLQNGRAPFNSAGFGGTWGPSRHPITGKIYCNEHALAGGSKSDLLILNTDGTYIVVGQIKAVTNYAAPNNAWEQGIIGNGCGFVSNGKLYVCSDNGQAQRNSALLRIDDVSVGTGTSYAANYDGFWGDAPPCPSCAGFSAHPVTDDLYTWRYNYSAGNFHQCGIVNKTTGLWGMTGTSNIKYETPTFWFPIDIKFKGTKCFSIWRSSATNTQVIGEVADITVANPVVDFKATITGQIALDRRAVAAGGAAAALTGLILPQDAREYA